MKKIFNIVIVALTLLALCGCGDLGFETQGFVDGTKMTAEIIAIGDKIEVEVIEGEYGASGIYWVIVSSDAVLETSDGKPINISDLSAGDRIAIIYSGQVMMSYPPQIVAKTITKLV